MKQAKFISCLLIGIVKSFTLSASEELPELDFQQPVAAIEIKDNLLPMAERIKILQSDLHADHDNDLQFTDIYKFKDDELSYVGSLIDGKISDKNLAKISQGIFVYAPYYTMMLFKASYVPFGAIIVGTTDVKLLQKLSNPNLKPRLSQ